MAKPDAGCTPIPSRSLTTGSTVTIVIGDHPALIRRLTNPVYWSGITAGDSLMVKRSIWAAIFMDIFLSRRGGTPCMSPWRWYLQFAHREAVHTLRSEGCG